MKILKYLIIAFFSLTFFGLISCSDTDKEPEKKKEKEEEPPAYVAVSAITGVPTSGFVNVPIILSGTVAPSDATNQDIVWSIRSQNGTGSVLEGNVLTASSVGLTGRVSVDAVIENGSTETSPFTRTFSINISEKIDEPLISAVDYVKGLGLAINIGNNLDAWDGETSWGNPAITRAYILKLKEFGFKTIRLPITWAANMGDAPGYIINAAYMTRVKTIVDWIIAEDMYCIINVHHDGHGTDSRVWIQDASKNYPDNAANADAVNNRLAVVWTQIAGQFKNYSNLLIFEGMNEIGFDDIWNRYGGADNPDTLARKTEAYRILKMLNQTFVDTVRSTGSHNLYRFLLIPGYWTDIQATCDSFFAMPSDTANDKLMISVHYYTPWRFAGQATGNVTATWGSTSQVNELNNLFNMMKTNFIDKGIPVILGEYNVIRSRDETERVKWLTAVTQKCIDLGINPVLWCNGGHFGVNQTHSGVTTDSNSRFFHDMGDTLREGSNSVLSTAMQTVFAQLNFQGQ